MNRKADLDRLAQLHDDDLHQVVKAVEWVVMSGSASLQRQGLKIVAMIPEGDPAQHARERRESALKWVAAQRGYQAQYRTFPEQEEAQEEAQREAQLRHEARFTTIYGQDGQILFQQEYPSEEEE